MLHRSMLFVMFIFMAAVMFILALYIQLLSTPNFSGHLMMGFEKFINAICNLQALLQCLCVLNVNGRYVSKVLSVDKIPLSILAMCNIAYLWLGCYCLLNINDKLHPCTSELITVPTISRLAGCVFLRKRT